MLKWLRGLLGPGRESAAENYRLGCRLENEGRVTEAAQAYRDALAADPGHAKAHNNLGGVLQGMGMEGEALACFETARRLDPSLWEPHYNIGNLHKLAGRLESAVAPFQESVRRKRGPGAAVGNDATFTQTSRSKLQHDIEQLRYLMQRGAPAQDYRRAVAEFESALAQLAPAFERGHLADIPAALRARLAPWYNRLLNYYDPSTVDGPAVNPALDRTRVEADYARNAPGIVWVDELLTPRALAELRRFCLDSTVWFDCTYGGGYLGANVEEGFICPLLAQIARELPLALPGIFASQPLTHLWAFKYDSTLTGIGVHGDFAGVNVNFWITPDDANLDPARGGLVVWDKEAPGDWDFEAYNKDVPRIERFLAETGARPVIVPYRQNRVVIFNSDLFHRTDDFRFRDGYENRRINVTLLYGTRGGRDSR
jgi:hypothetical protein